MKRWLMTVEGILMLVLWGISVVVDIGYTLNIPVDFHKTHFIIILMVVLSFMHFILNCWLIKAFRMKRWLMTVEGILMLVLWVINVPMDIFKTLINLFAFHLADIGIIMMVVLGLMHFILNCWLIKILSKSINRVGLVLLFITQTTPLFLLARRAWLSLVPCWQSDERSKDRRSLRAKYSHCYEVWSLHHTHSQPSDNNQGSPLVSCFQPNENSAVSDAPDQHSHDDPEAFSDSLMADILTDQDLKVSKTKFKPGSNIIDMDLSDTEEIYTGEPHLSKYLIQSFQDLYVDEKRLSYHIVTNSVNRILHASVSDKHIKVLREPQLCTDTHYMINFTRGHGFEHFHVIKNTCDEQVGFIKTDLSRIIWVLVWPSAAIKVYGALQLLHPRIKAPVFVPIIALIGIIISMATWLVTQRGADNPWINTLLQAPMRIAFTVCHTLLIVGIAIASLPLAASTYISAKALGILTCLLYLIFTKKVRNVELYSDEVDKYNFQPMYEPVIQFGEGVMYTIWALYWYYSEPDMQQPIVQGITISTIVGQIVGIVWLRYSRKHLRNPLRHPKKVLDFIQKLEYVRPDMENNDREMQ